MQIIEKNITELKEYENNPRNNEGAVDAVAESIKQFGFKVPIIIDSENIIIAGHTRKKAAEMLGLEKVPCVVADDLTPEQIKAFRLADNKVAEFAEWDYSRLEEEQEKILSSESGISLSDFGFEEDKFDNSAFFEETEVKEKEPKTVECPHCGGINKL